MACSEERKVRGGQADEGACRLRLEYVVEVVQLKILASLCRGSMK